MLNQGDANDLIAKASDDLERYKLVDFKDVAIVLNDILHKKPKSSLATVRNKYSHEVFYAVAKTPLIDNSEL